MYRLAQLLGLAIAAAIAFEGAIRVEDLVRYDMPLWSPVRSQADLLVQDAVGTHGRPNARWRKWRMNNVGTRGPDVASPKPPTGFRVITLGASETFGLYESPDREYPRQLEDSLRRGGSATVCSLHNRSIEVVNGALPGMSLPTFSQDLVRRLARLQPDIVVVYPTPVQYLSTWLPRAELPDSARPDSVLRPTGALHPRGPEQLRNGFKTMLPKPIAGWLRRRAIERAVPGRPGRRFTRVPRRRLAAFEQDLRTLVGEIRGIDAAPLLVSHATRFEPNELPDPELLTMWQRFYPRAAGSTLIAFDSLGRVATGAVARDSAAILVDWAASIPSPRERWFADYSHFTDAGAGLLAGRIAAAILRHRGCPG